MIKQTIVKDHSLKQHKKNPRIFKFFSFFLNVTANSQLTAFYNMQAFYAILWYAWDDSQTLTRWILGCTSHAHATDSLRQAKINQSKLEKYDYIKAKLTLVLIKK